MMAKPDYWRVYIVMVKPEGAKIYKPFVGINGCVVAHETRDAARHCLRGIRQFWDGGKLRAYIQKCGAIS